VYLNVAVDVLEPEPVRSLSTVVTLTFTDSPAVPAGAVASTVDVDPQSRIACWLLADSAFTLPKNTRVTQPRFWPLITTGVPPAAGPEVGLTELTLGLPGGYRIS